VTKAYMGSLTRICTIMDFWRPIMLSDMWSQAKRLADNSIFTPNTKLFFWAALRKEKKKITKDEGSKNGTRWSIIDPIMSHRKGSVGPSKQERTQWSSHHNHVPHVPVGILAPNADSPCSLICHFRDNFSRLVKITLRQVLIPCQEHCQSVTAS